MKRITIATLGIMLCLSLVPSAMEIHQYCDEDDGLRTESGVFEEDYLFLGHELSFSGAAQDLIFLGKDLTFSGKTTLGLFALAKRVAYTGVVGNGMWAGCLDVSVDGVIDGNSFVACKSFHLSEQSVVNGNLFIAGAKLVIDGTIDGDLYVGAGEIVINGEITGDVVAHGGRVLIGEDGAIEGSLTYSAKEKLSEEELSRVSGTVQVKDGPGFDRDSFFPEGMTRAIQFLIGLGFFISFVAVGSLLLFLPAFRRLDTSITQRAFWTTGLWGLIPVLMYPGLIVVCFVLVITIPFAFVLMLSFVPLFFLAYIIGTTLLGKYIALKFKWNISKRHYHFLIGLLAAGILSIIPFVNVLVCLFLCALGWGMFLSFLFNRDFIHSEK